MIEFVINLFMDFGRLVKDMVLVDASNRLYWYYLLIFLSVSSIIYLIRKPDHISLFGFLFPKKVYTSLSFLVDLKIYFINGLIGGVIALTTLLASSALIADLVTATFSSLTGVEGLHWKPEIYSTALFSVAFLLFSDFGTFFAHYLHHKVPVLWAFHKVHHSAEELTPVTGFRFHPVEMILDGAVIACTVGPVIGIYRFFYDGILFDTAPYLFGVVTIAWLFTANFRHSHVPIHYPRAISGVIVSPAMHNLHHSTNPKHFDKNFGFMFSIWDRIANSYLLPDRSEVLQFGIGKGEEKNYRSAFACYWLPVKENLARLSIYGNKIKGKHH